MKKHTKRAHTKRAHTKKPSSEPSVVVVGKIFANWCGHCQSLLPEWKKLVHEIKTKMKTNRKSHTKYVVVEIEQQHQDAGIQRVNSTYLKNSGHTLALQGGYPTLFKITDGTLEYYNGPRTYLEMLDWYMSTKTETGGNHVEEISGEPSILPIAKYENVGGKVDGKLGGKVDGKLDERKTRKSRIYSRKTQTRSNRGWFSFLF
jgi:thiol-disulfide isomerase/thioredoxin